MAGTVFDDVLSDTKEIPLSYSKTDSHGSALKLVYSVCPEWETAAGPVDIEPFTERLMNTVCQSSGHFFVGAPSHNLVVASL